MTAPALLVRLVGTANAHLAGLVPIDGELTVTEFARDGMIIHATFRILDEDGTLRAPVVCPQPVFTYGHAHAAALWRRRQYADPPPPRAPIARPRAALMAQNRGSVDRYLMPADTAPTARPPAEKGPTP